MIHKVAKRIIVKTRAAAQLFLDVPYYLQSLREFRRQLQSDGDKARLVLRPRLGERGEQSHTFDAHYVYLTGWVMQKLAHAKPLSHVDVGSSMYVVIATASQCPVTFVDVRPSTLAFPNVEVQVGDVTRLAFPDNSITSLSCLHVVEHIGLGRYGDAVNAQGLHRALMELARVLKPGGKLYLALPVGLPVVHFNAHRVTSPISILEWLPQLRMVSFSIVDDAGNYIPDVLPEAYTGATYACGLYEFTKP